MSRIEDHGIQLSLSWIPATNGNKPYHALRAGGGTFVGRGFLKNEMIPGKLVEGHRALYIPHGGEEHSVDIYEVLCNTTLPQFGMSTIYWKEGEGGHVPRGAVVGGHTDHAEPLYIARDCINGEVVVGKVQQSHGCAYFPWGGEEHRREYYDVLCLSD